MLKAPRLFLCLNGRETYAYIPPEVVARACEMDLLTYLRALSIPREIAQHDRSN